MRVHVLSYTGLDSNYCTCKCDLGSIVTGSFLNTMKFVSKDCDPTTGEPDEGTGFDDEYVVRRVGFGDESYM